MDSMGRPQGHVCKAHGSRSELNRYHVWEPLRYTYPATLALRHLFCNPLNARPFPLEKEVATPEEFLRYHRSN